MKRLPGQNRRLPDHRGLECRDAEEFQTLPDHLEEKPTAVNGRSMEETVEAFGAVLSADNGVKLRRQYRQSCNVAEFYEYLELARAGDPLELTLAGGEALALAPVSAEELARMDLVRLSDGLPQPVTGVQDRFYLAFPLDEGTYYIQYNSCREDPELPMETFAAQVEQDLSAGQYRRVVVDLRNNGGGSDGVLVPILMLVPGLVEEGQTVEVSESVSPVNVNYMIEPAVAMSGLFKFNERLKSRQGVVKKIVENDRGFYVTVEFDE